MPTVNSLLNVGSNALLVNQSAIHVTGNNIANVDTPGYSRETLLLQSSPALNLRPGQIGQGAYAKEVMRHFDYFIERSYLQKNGAQSRYQAQYGMLQSIESVFNEANSKGLASMMGSFFTAWSGLGATPDNQAVREVLVSDSQNLANVIRQTESYLSDFQSRLDTYIQQDVAKVNELLVKIAGINREIQIYDDPGRNNANTLLDQRDMMVRELSSYIDVEIVNRGSGDYTIYTKSGQTLVENITPFSLSYDGPKTSGHFAPGSTFNGTAEFSGSSPYEYTLDFVNGGAVGAAEYRVSLDGGNTWLKDSLGNDQLFTATDSDSMTFVQGLGLYFDGTGNFATGDRFTVVPKSALYWVTPTNQPMNVSPQLLANGTENSNRISGGSLAGYLYVKDYEIGNYRDQLNNFAKSLIWEVNRQHSQGVGLVKNDTMFGDYRVQAPDIALGSFSSGLTFQDRLQEGNVTFYVFDKASGEMLPGAFGPLDFGGGANFDPAVHTLEDVRDAINNTFGPNLAASIQDNRLVIGSDPDVEFAVGADTSGLMAALGLNTFFSGNGSTTIAVNEAVVQDRNKICAGLINGGFEGNVGDNDTAKAIANLASKNVNIPPTGLNKGTSTSLAGYYGVLVGKVGSDTADAKFNWSYNKTLAQDLDVRQSEISGVNLDEELTVLIKFQNSYKAAAKLITTADQMYQTLLGLKQ